MEVSALSALFVEANDNNCILNMHCGGCGGYEFTIEKQRDVVVGQCTKCSLWSVF